MCESDPRKIRLTSYVSASSSAAFLVKKMTVQENVDEGALAQNAMARPNVELQVANKTPIYPGFTPPEAPGVG